MSAPDPTAALREYIREREEWLDDKWRSRDEAPILSVDEARSLLAYIERLEAALATLAIAMLPPV